MTTNASVDIVIFGGGVAGLWMLNRIRQAGFAAILCESTSLGGGQTCKSQGIIHGGMKYALQGQLTAEAAALSDMPARWRTCLQGAGEIDLSRVTVLSDKHYLWAPNKLTAKLAGGLASVTLASKVEPLDKSDYPILFQHPAFKGEVFALDEMVLDTHSLIRELVRANQDAIFKIQPTSPQEWEWDTAGRVIAANVYCGSRAVRLEAQQFIFAAGSGNECLAKPLPQVAMQRRPLHMVMAKVPPNWLLYAHCMGLSTRPRVTITTHHAQDGSLIWYIGGMLAEEGVQRDTAAQIQAAKQELSSLFPWLSFDEVEWATLRVDRAEPLQADALKPNQAYYKAIQNMVITWPVKLALAPQLADEVLAHMRSIPLTPQLLDTQALRAWPMPPLSQPIWETSFCHVHA